MDKELDEESKARIARIRYINYLIKVHRYNWSEAIEKTAEKIVENPESLLWS